MKTEGADSKTPRPALGSRVGATIFGFFFCLIPLAIITLILLAAWQVLSTRFWPQVPCTIEESLVEFIPITVDKPETFVFKVRYSYEFAGRKRVSSTYQHSYEGSEDESATRALAARYAPGAKAFCYVKPAALDTSVLAHERFGKFILLTLVILFPLFFLAVGVSIIVATWRTERPHPLSSSKTRGSWIMFWFFGIFLVAGLGTFFGIAVPGYFDLLKASSWKQTPCTILDSKVLSVHGSKGDTYKVGVVFSYTVNSVEYRSNRYNLWTSSSSGHDSKQEIVSHLPAGTSTVCWVNPSNPREAVLSRAAGWESLLMLFPLIFIAVGFFGIRWIWRSTHGKVSRITSNLTGLPVRSQSPGFALPARPEASGLTKVVLLLLFVLFWNGIVSIFVFQAFHEWQAGHSPWGLTLFLVPFVLVGLVMVGMFFYYLLALFNPRVQITLTPAEAPLGSSVNLAWEVFGRSDRLRGLNIALEGRETATYQEGKNSRTDSSTFYHADLLDTTSPAAIPDGRARFGVPPDLMHTFASPANSVKWHVVVKGDIPHWPDVNEEFELVVLPRPVSSPHQSPLGEGPSESAGASETGVAIELDSVRRAFAPGEQVQGFIAWQFERPPRNIEVHLFWHTTGLGTEDIGKLQVVSFDNCATADRRPFTFTLPEGPYSFTGKLITLAWAIEAIAQPGDRNHRIDIVLSPTGKAIVLSEVAKQDGTTFSVQ